jgi:hypothetical protein
MVTKQIVRPRNFVEELVREYPLYSKLPLTQPISSNELRPEVLLLRCQFCRTDRPFHPIRDPNEVKRIVPFEGWGGFDIPPPDLSFKLLLYSCTTCRSLFQCLIEINRKNGYLRKLGQDPPYSIEIPRPLETDLGEDVALYKNALICLSQSYGIGACIYLRRLLESKINPLLTVFYEIRKAEQASPEELSDIEGAINEFVFDDKIKLVSRVVPNSLPESVSNPITLTYSRLSDGIHNRSDEECVEIAKRAKSVLIRLLSDLKREHQLKRAYVNDIKALSTP